MTASSVNPSRLPWDRKTAAGPGYWHAGLAVVTLLLAVQLIYFEGAALSRHPAFRASLEKICVQLNCQLPPYRNLGELTVTQGSLTALPDRSQLFRVVIRNRAVFVQPYPRLELTLLDYAGNPFARRIFRPQDYVFKPQEKKAVLPPDGTVAISLNIAATKTRIGGYTFKLID